MVTKIYEDDMNLSMKKKQSEKLSPKDEKRLAELTLQQKTARKLLFEFTLKHIKTLEDMLHVAGFSKQHIHTVYFESERNHPVTISDVKDYISDRHIELTTRHWLEDNPPRNVWSEHDTEQIDSDIYIPHFDVTEHAGVAPPIGANVNQGLLDKEDTNSYGLEPCDRDFPSGGKLLAHQRKYTKVLLDGITVYDKKAQYLAANPGDGKTIIAGALIVRLLAKNFVESKGNYSPWPIIYVTATSVVQQIQGDFKDFFGITEDEVLVTGYDQLRATFGERFLKQTMKVKSGKEIAGWQWRKMSKPLIIFWDEGHKLKNERSTQSQIAQAINDADEDDSSTIYQIFSSATPGVRVADFKCFSVATQADFNNGPLTNEKWPMFAQSMCDGFMVNNKDGSETPAQPQDYCPPAAARLRKYLNDYFVHVKGVRPQFKAHNFVELIEFSNAQEEREYANTLEEMQQKLAKLHAKDGLSAQEIRLQEITILLFFRMKAEILKVPWLARTIFECVSGTYHKHPGIKFMPLIAVNFKQTITALVKVLVNDYNIPRSKICLTWGGGKTASAKSLAKDKLQKNDAVMAALQAEGITMEDLDLDLVEAKMEEELEPSLRLGVQSKQQRQDEILKSNSGKALVHIFTYRAGGTGLSLPHTDRYTKEKVRRKESGYAYIEDIPLIPTRPKITFGAASWSSFEIVQGFGRGPRIISLSDTYQYLVYYKNTVEARVAGRASMALRGLREILKSGIKESWENLIIGREDVTRTSMSEEDEEGAGGYFDGDEDNNDNNNENEK